MPSCEPVNGYHLAPGPRIAPSFSHTTAPILRLRVTANIYRVAYNVYVQGHPYQMASLQRVAEATLPTCYGTCRMLVYGAPDGKEHVALVIGSLGGPEPVLVRLHSECMTGDVFGSSRCDCGEQLAHSLDLLHKEGRGVLLYMRQEGRGIGLTNKIRAYALQDQGYDTVEANHRLGLPKDMREYGLAADMLIDLDVRQVRLLTNNPAKIAGLARHGIAVVERLPLQVPPTRYNHAYLRTKQQKMGHLLPADLALPV